MDIKKNFTMQERKFYINQSGKKKFNFFNSISAIKGGVGNFSPPPPPPPPQLWLNVVFVAISNPKGHFVSWLDGRGWSKSNYKIFIGCFLSGRDAHSGPTTRTYARYTRSLGARTVGPGQHFLQSQARTFSGSLKSSWLWDYWWCLEEPSSGCWGPRLGEMEISAN